MPTTATGTIGGKKLEPLYPQPSKHIAVRLKASATYVRGQVLGALIGTNERQTLTVTGAPTGGDFTITFGDQTTDAIAYNALASAVQTALEALSNIGDGNVVVTGGPLPAYPLTIQFTGALGGENVAAITTTNSFTGGTSPDTTIATATGGEAGTGGTFAAFDDDNTDGTEVARVLCIYDCVTDSAGKVTFGDAADANEKHLTAPVYIGGTFATADLTNLTEKAVADLGRIVQGTIEDGILAVNG